MQQHGSKYFARRHDRIMVEIVQISLFFIELTTEN